MAIRRDEIDRLRARIGDLECVLRDDLETEKSLRAEVERLRKDARRWFTADGEVDMEPDEVIEKRRQAAVELGVLRGERDEWRTSSQWWKARAEEKTDGN